MKIGIRIKMFLGIMVPALMVFLLSGVLISVSVGKYAKVQAREKLTSDSESAAHEVDTFFTGHLKAVEQSAQEALVIDFMHELRGSQRARPWIHLPYWGSGWLIPIPASFFSRTALSVIRVGTLRQDHGLSAQKQRSLL